MTLLCDSLMNCKLYFKKLLLFNFKYFEIADFSIKFQKCIYS